MQVQTAEYFHGFGFFIINYGALSGAQVFYHACVTDDFDPNMGFGIRPIVELNSNVLLYGGDGTYEHPYKLTLN